MRIPAIMKPAPALALALIVALGLASCEENHTTIIQQSGSTFRVQGQVRMSSCQSLPFDTLYPLLHEVSLAARGYHDSALVTFVRLSGLRISLYTDSVSGFDALIDEGPYAHIITKTRWGPPDTVSNVYVSADTSLTIVTRQLVADPDNLVFNFRYDLSDTADALSEWSMIRTVNGIIGGRLQIAGSAPPDSLLALRKVDTLSYSNTIRALWPLTIKPEYDLYSTVRMLELELLWINRTVPYEMSASEAAPLICLFRKSEGQ